MSVAPPLTVVGRTHIEMLNGELLADFRAEMPLTVMYVIAEENCRAWLMTPMTNEAPVFTAVSPLALESSGGEAVLKVK